MRALFYHPPPAPAALARPGGRVTRQPGTAAPARRAWPGPCTALRARRPAPLERLEPQPFFPSGRLASAAAASACGAPAQSQRPAPRAAPHCMAARPRAMRGWRVGTVEVVRRGGAGGARLFLSDVDDLRHVVVVGVDARIACNLHAPCTAQRPTARKRELEEAARGTGPAAPSSTSLRSPPQ